MTDSLPSDILNLALDLDDSRPKEPTPAFIKQEMARCTVSNDYFINTYCKIYDNDKRTWIPFTLWPFQTDVLKQATVERRLVALKTRQVGVTWLLGIAYALHQILFHPIAEVLMFSQRDEEAMALLADQRLGGMYDQLPGWMKQKVVTDSAHEFRIENGSGVRALPATAGGDSRTVTLVFIDEVDLIENPDRLITRAEPTLGQEGQMFVVGRADKSKPNSYFKRLYQEAKRGDSVWKPVFIPWFAHPKRNKVWYDQECRNALNTAGTLDPVHEHYPATDVEALSARTLDKRVPPHWIVAVQRERQPLETPIEVQQLPGLRIYIYPEDGHHYAIGADPAEGNPNSDDSVACVIDATTKEQVATLSGQIEPGPFGDVTAKLSAYYLSAPVLPERNNHGHLMIDHLKKNKALVPLRNGMDDKPGWITSQVSKTILYDTATQVIQEHLEHARALGEEPTPIIYDFLTASQLASIEVDTLRAPEGDHDDYAAAWALAQMCGFRGKPGMFQQPYSGLYKSKDDQSQHDRAAYLPGPSSWATPLIPANDPGPKTTKRKSDSDIPFEWKVRFRGK